MKQIYKLCHTCGKNKIIEEFVKTPHQRVGTRALCNSCFNGR